MSTAIAIYVFDGAEELDWAGPWEVLTAWSELFPDDDVSVFTISDTDAPVRCAKGLRVLADHVRAAAPDFDVLVYPGGRGTRAHLADPYLVRKIQLGQESTIRPCVGATYCLDRIYMAGEALCIHNASTGRELTMPRRCQSAQGRSRYGGRLFHRLWAERVGCSALAGAGLVEGRGLEMSVTLLLVPGLAGHAYTGPGCNRVQSKDIEGALPPTPADN